MADGRGGEARQYVTKVGQWFNLVPLAGGDEVEEYRGSDAAVVGAAEEPVLVADGDAPQGVLGGVVVNRQIAVAGVHVVGVPLIQRVGDGLAHRALGQDRSATLGLLDVQPGFGLFEPRQGPLLTQRVADRRQRRRPRRHGVRVI